MTCTLMRCLAPPVLRVSGARVVPDRLDQVVFPRLALGIFERGETRLLQRMISSQSVFVDVGANCGYYTALALRAGASVLAFEPEPRNYRLLTCTASSNSGNAQLHRLALGAEPGAGTLFRNPANRGDHRTRNFDAATDQVPVEVRCLDEWLPALNRTRQLVVKIDVQGDEPAVVRGALRFLRAVPDTTVLFEFHPDGLRAAGHVPRELLNQFRALGFGIQAVDDYGTLLEMTTADADALADAPSGEAFASLVATRLR